MKKENSKKVKRFSGIRIAHRGLWNSDNPENSIGAFKRAIDRNVAIELDVHILNDNTLVVFHDGNTSRMTGVDINLSNTNYNDIKDLKLKNTKYNIPKFNDILELVNGRVLLDIEIKGGGNGFRVCREICKYLDNYKGDFVIKSFNPLYILWFRIYRFNYVRGLLISKSIDVNKIKIYKFLTNPDFIAIDYKRLPCKMINRLRNEGLPILIFTLKERDITNYNYDGYIYEEL